MTEAKYWLELRFYILTNHALQGNGTNDAYQALQREKVKILEEQAAKMQIIIMYSNICFFPIIEIHDNFDWFQVANKGFI